MRINGVFIYAENVLFFHFIDEAYCEYAHNGVTFFKWVLGKVWE